MKINYSQPAEVIANEAIEYYKNNCYPNFHSNPDAFKLFDISATKDSIKLAIDKFEDLKEVCDKFEYYEQDLAISAEYEYIQFCRRKNPKYLKICEVLDYLNKLYL